MYSFSHPSPAEMDRHLRRAHALRSDAICGMFRRLASLFAHRGHIGQPAKLA
jgi:hypothetical protein